MAHIAGSAFGRALRAAAPVLTKRFFSCQARETHILKVVRHKSSQSCDLAGFSARRQISPRGPIRSTALREASRAFSQSARRNNGTVVAPKIEQKSSFPESSSNTVAYWLLASAASVFGIVVFGGLTRLTESG